MKQKRATPYALLPTPCYQKGFTILELIISIAIIALISVGVGIELIGYQRAAALDAASKDIVNELRAAQNKALSGEDGTVPPDGAGDAWGVRFSNRTPATYAKFYGSVFNSANITATTTLSSSVTFTDPSANTDKDIIFTKITGTTTPAVITITAADSSQTKIIIIDASGRITVSSCPATVQDADGNTYNTVVINNQCWMKENLRTGVQLATGATTPSNNGIIQKWCPAPNGTAGSVDNLQYAANCYSNDGNSLNDYGGLYNWDEAMGYSTTEGVQGICMTSWHIPTDAEQYALENFLKITGQTCSATRSGAWDCNDAGTKLKSGGSSGFQGLLAGYRGGDSAFYGLGTNTYFWSSTQSGANAWNRDLFTSFATVDRYANPNALGFSVRCLKN